MTQYNDYKTPRERISGEFRRALDGSAPVFAPSGAHVCGTGKAPVSSVRGENGRVSPKNVFSSLAMVYSGEQEFGELYGDEAALEHGTLFKELDFPFEAAFCGMKKTAGGMKR